MTELSMATGFGGRSGGECAIAASTPRLYDAGNSEPSKPGTPALEPTTASDEALIDACREGNTHAWEEVLNKYERLVYSIPLNYGLSHDDAADVVQTTFTSLIQSLDTLRADSRLGSWLATVAQRNTWRLIARARREDSTAYEVLAEHTASVDPAGAEALDRLEQIEWVHSGLSLLNCRCRDLLLALYFAGPEPTYAQVAGIMGVPVGSIGPTRARCLERLKHALQATAGT